MIVLYNFTFICKLNPLMHDLTAVIETSQWWFQFLARQSSSVFLLCITTKLTRRYSAALHSGQIQRLVMHDLVYDTRGSKSIFKVVYIFFKSGGDNLFRFLGINLSIFLR